MQLVKKTKIKKSVLYINRFELVPGAISRGAIDETVILRRHIYTHVQIDCNH